MKIPYGSLVFLKTNRSHIPKGYHVVIKPIREEDEIKKYNNQHFSVENDSHRRSNDYSWLIENERAEQIHTL